MVLGSSRSPRRPSGPGQAIAISRGRRPCRDSPVQDIRHPATAEVADVHAFGSPDAYPGSQRWVNVPEQGQPWLMNTNRPQGSLTAAFEAPGHHVVGQL